MESGFIFFHQLLKLTQRQLKLPTQFLVHCCVRSGRLHTWAELSGTFGLPMLLVGEELQGVQLHQRAVQIPPLSSYPGDPGSSTCRTCLKWRMGFMSYKREAIKKRKYLKSLWFSDVGVTASSQAACSSLSL